MRNLLEDTKALTSGPADNGIAERQKTIDEYKNATKPAPAPARPAAPVKPAPMDKVKPSAKFGDRPGEKRINVDDMLKPLPSYKHGTDYVPKTGPAILHEGEKVTTKEENMKNLMGLAADHMSNDKPSKPKKEIKHIITRKVKNSKGGHSYVHQHVHTHPEHHPDEEHAANDQDAMVDHMLTHMGEPNPGEAEADAGQSGTPGDPQAAPSPMAGA